MPSEKSVVLPVSQMRGREKLVQSTGRLREITAEIRKAPAKYEPCFWKVSPVENNPERKRHITAKRRPKNTNFVSGRNEKKEVM